MTADETRPHFFLRRRLRAAVVDVVHGKSAHEIAAWTGLPLERAQEILEIALDGATGMTGPMRWTGDASTPPKKGSRP